MTQTDWEVVDDHAEADAHAGIRREPSRPHEPVLKSLLGRWWKWKLAGLAVAAGALALVAGAMVLLVFGLVLMALTIRRIKLWLTALFGSESRTPVTGRRQIYRP
jgi:hypothetical protein